jgi:hypothetical protein
MLLGSCLEVEMVVGYHCVKAVSFTEKLPLYNLFSSIMRRILIHVKAGSYPEKTCIKPTLQENLCTSSEFAHRNRRSIALSDWRERRLEAKSTHFSGRSLSQSTDGGQMRKWPFEDRLQPG